MKKMVSYNDAVSVGTRLPTSVQTEVTTLAIPNIPNAVTKTHLSDDCVGGAELDISGTLSSSTFVKIDASGNLSAVAPSGTGDASTNTTTSVVGEVAQFIDTSGKRFGRSTISGIPKFTSGVMATATAGTDYVTPAGAETLSGKRIVKRVVSVTSSATPSIDLLVTDMFRLTAQAVDITGFTVTGDPGEGSPLWVIIIPTATRAITWGASFEGTLLPSSAPGTTRLDVGFVWNSVTSKLKCVGVC